MSEHVVQFLRVVSAASTRARPDVTAFVDGRFKVTWRQTHGWTCRDCDEDGESCSHVDAVSALLAPSTTKRPTTKASRKP